MHILTTIIVGNNFIKVKKYHNTDLSNRIQKLITDIKTVCVKILPTSQIT